MKRPSPRHQTTSRIQLDPFHPKPDKRFYYAFEAFEQRLAVLRRLLRGSEALILVIGERGSGKTTLLQRILATTKQPWKTCRVQTAVSLAAGGLSRIKQRGQPSAFLLQNPGGTVILMDDAHRLARKELRKLLLQVLAPDPARKIKRMVLFGEPRISTNFDTASGGLVDKTAINKIHLPNITEDEAAAYIRHRLAVAGFTGKNPFTPDILKRLYRNSGGLTGRLTIEASRWLQQKGHFGSARRGQSRIKRIRLLRLMAWFAAAVAAIILGRRVLALREIGSRTGLCAVDRAAPCACQDKKRPAAVATPGRHCSCFAGHSATPAPCSPGR